MNPSCIRAICSGIRIFTFSRPMSSSADHWKMRSAARLNVSMNPSEDAEINASLVLAITASSRSFSSIGHGSISRVGSRSISGTPLLPLLSPLSIGHAKLGLKTQAPAGRAGSGLAVAEGVIGHDEHDAAVAAVAAVDLSLQLVVVVSAEGPLTTTTFFFFSALLIFAAADVASSSSSPASSSSAFVGGGKSLMQFTMRRQNAGPAALVLCAIF
mmetsp:Transcript_11765/g.31170  ORF Transcript_11765/g.31170 Transcript_11765/m.31170 type:complete len:214 (-) Transcript_11765:104-745(-)